MAEFDTPSPVNQVILIGASNVTIGFATVTRLLRGGFSEPLDLRAAIGHGRSYGTWSRFAGRALPGIRECGLWRSLEHSQPAHRHALLTDIGNDLLYGRSVEEIASWVKTCLDRLGELQADCIITRLPVARVERLSASRYHATRLLFFPGHRPVRWSAMLDRVRELDERVTHFADAAGAKVITPQGDWYGIDPIHIRRRFRPTAWNSIFSVWPDFDATSEAQPPAPRLLGRFPEHYRLFGQTRSSPQPVFSNGELSLSLY